MVQEVSFDISPDDELIATFQISMTIQLNSSLPADFQRSIIFDNNSTIENLTYSEEYSGMHSRKIFPKILDYEADGIFHSDLKICNFKIENLTKSQELQIKYSKKFNNHKFIDPLYFNDFYKVKNSVIEIKVPSWLDLDIKEWNLDMDNIAYGKENLSGEMLHVYTIRELPSSFDIVGKLSRSNFSPHIILIPRSFTSKKGHTRLMEDLSDLYNWYRKLVKEIGNENEVLKSKVNELISDTEKDEERVKKIFYWVQDNIKYIAFEEGIMGFRPENCQTVFKNKYGDCKGMANLTKEMLKLAGYDARLSWIGTSDLPYTYDMPSLIVDNHMICTMMLNGKRIFLDATEKYADLYNYAHRIRGKQILIENDDKYLIEEVPTQKPENNKQIVENFYTIKDNKLTGTGKVTFTGNQKTSTLNKLAAISQLEREKELRNYFTNGNQNVNLKLTSDISFENRDNDLNYNYNIEIENQVVNLGHELYVNLELGHSFQQLKMSSKRSVPFDFNGTFLLANKMKLNIPSNYIVKYLPEKVAVDTKNYTFNLFIEKIGNEIFYTKRILIKNPLLKVSDFKEWNKLIAKLNTFYEDQIILEKI